MHPYATDSSERKIILLGIMILSLLLAYGLNRGLVLLNLSIPWWIDSPSVIGFFGLLYQIFDRHLWKRSILRRLGLSRIPDLNGTWKGRLHSSHDQFTVDKDVTLSINQTWTNIRIELRTDHSHSESLMAAIMVRAAGDVALTYQYRNEPGVQAVETMHAHRGTAWLSYTNREAKDMLEGDYYSGRDRQNMGRLMFERLKTAQPVQADSACPPGRQARRR